MCKIRATIKAESTSRPKGYGSSPAVNASSEMARIVINNRSSGSLKILLIASFIHSQFPGSWYGVTYSISAAPLTVRCSV